MPIDYFGFAYAATVAGGGIFGYVKARKYSFTSHLFLKWVDVFLITYFAWWVTKVPSFPAFYAVCLVEYTFN